MNINFESFSSGSLAILQFLSSYSVSVCHMALCLMVLWRLNTLNLGVYIF